MQADALICRQMNRIVQIPCKSIHATSSQTSSTISCSAWGFNSVLPLREYFPDAITFQAQNAIGCRSTSTWIRFAKLTSSSSFAASTGSSKSNQLPPRSDDVDLRLRVPWGATMTNPSAVSKIAVCVVERASAIVDQLHAKSLG